MDKYQETFDTWNKVAKLYQEKFIYLNLYDESYNLFIDLLPNARSSVLDIGCGPGNITHYLLSQKPSLTIIGVDIAKNMIELAKINNPLANFEVMDSRNLNQIKDQFDAALACFCIPYLSQQDCIRLIADCHKLLAENGILYFSYVEGI